MFLVFKYDDVILLYVLPPLEKKYLFYFSCQRKYCDHIEVANCLPSFQGLLSSTSNTCDYLDTLTNEWVNARRMNDKRYGAAYAQTAHGLFVTSESQS